MATQRTYQSKTAPARDMIQGSATNLLDKNYQAELQSDCELLELYVLGGQHHALIVLVKRFTPMVSSVIRRVVSNHQDSEDAFQATWLIFMQSAKKIRSQRSIAAWLYGVSYRTACRVRAHSRRLSTGLEEMEFEDPDSHDDPITKLVREIELKNLDRELQRLPQGYREPLVEHYILGYSAKEIAERMDLSTSAVEGRLRRGRQLLRQVMAERGASLSVCAAGIQWMREHQTIQSTSQSMASDFVESAKFQSPDLLSELDPYLFKLVEGNAKMQTTSFLKSIGFFGTVTVATISLGVFALGMQLGGASNQSTSQVEQNSNQFALQTASADEPSTSSSVEGIDTSSVSGDSNLQPATSSPNPTPQMAPATGGGGFESVMVGGMSGGLGDMGGGEGGFGGGLGGMGGGGLGGMGGGVNFIKPSGAPPRWLQSGKLDRQATEETRDKLRERLELVLDEVPLSDVIQLFQDKTGVNFLMTGNSELLGETVTLRQSLPLHQALRLILDPMGLTYEVHPNLVKIVDENEREESQRFYDLSYVIPNSSCIPDILQLVTSIASEASVVGSLMVVTADENSHLQIEKLLSEIAEIAPENLGG